MSEIVATSKVVRCTDHGELFKVDRSWQLDEIKLFVAKHIIKDHPDDVANMYFLMHIGPEYLSAQLNTEILKDQEKEKDDG